MSPSPKIAYFGYGSLVNLDTLRTPYISAHRVRLKGWRRVWLTRPNNSRDFAYHEKLALLSVEPHRGTTIEGLLVIDHRSSLPALDERETSYDRVKIARNNIEFLNADPLDVGTELFLYVARQAPATEDDQILRSYLDAVMQGYHYHFGEQGVERFFATTGNFDCSILEDRKTPQYPRAVQLSDHERELFLQFALPKSPNSL